MIPEQIIYPLKWETFIDEFLGKKPYINTSNEKKFNEILTWSEINRIILEHRLEHPRLRMFKNVQLIPASEYVNKTTSRRGSVSPTILMREFNEEILNGATLIIDAIQEMSSPIRELCENFNFSLKGICQANAYIALADQQAFDTHWDGHDVFVLQITGEKHWKIYHPTRANPLDTDLDKEKYGENQIEKVLFWEGTIKEGDVLYIPRGWWHSVSPVGKETIHISIGYNPPTGVDFLKWISNQLLKEDDFRESSPLFSDKRIQNIYIERLRSLINQKLTADSYRQHIEDRIGKLSPRIPSALPYSADIKATSLPSSIMIKSSHRNIVFKAGENSIKITAFNKRYEVSAQYLEIVAMLYGATDNKFSISEIKSRCNSIAEETIDKFIIFLLRLGLLQIC